MLIAALLMLAAAQEATVARPEVAADGGQRWSILVDACATERTAANEIVVCGAATESARLPLPDERGVPDRPVPSNPNRSGAGALAATSSPCATLSQGCTVGLDIFGAGTFLVRAVGKLVDPDSCCEEPGEATSVVGLAKDVAGVVKRSVRKKPDKSKRVPIPLDDLPAETKPEAPPATP